jgi:hypothetical protein
MRSANLSFIHHFDSFQAFDRESEIKACTNYRQVLFFLWAIHKDMLGHTIDMAVDESEYHSSISQQGQVVPPTILQQQVDARDDEEEEDKIPADIPQFIPQNDMNIDPSLLNLSIGSEDDTASKLTIGSVGDSSPNSASVQYRVIIFSFLIICVYL